MVINLVQLEKHPHYIEYYNLTHQTTKTELSKQELDSILRAAFCVRITDTSTGFDTALTDADVPVVFESKEHICSAGNMEVPRALTIDKEISQRQVDIKFDDVNADWRAVVSSYALKNSVIKIDLVYLSPLDASVIYSVPWFVGSINSTKYSDDPFKGKCELTISCDPKTAKLSEGQKMYASDSVWQNLYPGDKFFSEIGKSTDKIWKA